MLTNEWKNVEGFSNTGEDYENIAARRMGDVVQVAYMAFAGLKVVELKGVEDIVKPDYSNVLDFVNEYGDDWEIGIYVKNGDEVLVVTVDCCSEANDGKNIISCVSSEEYDATMLEELDEELLELYDLV